MFSDFYLKMFKNIRRIVCGNFAHRVSSIRNIQNKKVAVCANLHVGYGIVFSGSIPNNPVYGGSVRKVRFANKAHIRVVFKAAGVQF